MRTEILDRSVPGVLFITLLMDYLRRKYNVQHGKGGKAAAANLRLAKYALRAAIIDVPDKGEPRDTIVLYTVDKIRITIEYTGGFPVEP